jgi:hypothetical protein
MVNSRLLLICFAACLLAAPLAQADYYFYGVASDDFTPDNDTLWAALEPYPEWDASRSTLYDDRNVWAPAGQESVYSDLQGYANDLVSGDVFLFSYSGHGGWGAVDWSPGDEGSTPRPTANDPSPSSNPPYQYDEWLPSPSGGNGWWLSDDELTDAFANFDDCVEVVVLSGACHSGGWVGGSHDIDNSVPASNNGLYAILGAPEQGYGIGVGPSGGPYEILLTTALSNSLDAYMTGTARLSGTSTGPRRTGTPPPMRTPTGPITGAGRRPTCNCALRTGRASTPPTTTGWAPPSRPPPPSWPWGCWRWAPGCGGGRRTDESARSAPRQVEYAGPGTSPGPFRYLLRFPFGGLSGSPQPMRRQGIASTSRPAKLRPSPSTSAQATGSPSAFTRNIPARQVAESLTSATSKLRRSSAISR